MKYFSLVFVFLLKVLFICCQQRLDLNVVREWKQLDFDFPNSQARDEAIRKGYFVQHNAVPIDVDVDYQVSLDNSRIFVTIPRFSEGIPITLGYVTFPKSSTLIKPYPSYSWHSSHGASCDGITSVLRVAIDECNQLWVLDTGKIGSVRKCPPQLLVFNLANDNLVKRYKFPQSQYNDVSLLITPILDIEDPAPKGRCTNTKVYIADVTSFALIVYDSVHNKSWKIQNKLFFPFPNYGTFTIAGESFDLMDGILGLALSPRKKTSDGSNELSLGRFNRQAERFLYFHALASGHENAVPLRIINNASIWETDENSLPRAFRVIGTRGIQAAAQAMDSQGNMFFVTMSPIALACWDSSKPYSLENIKLVRQNDETLQFASGLKIVKNLYGVEELWVFTNRFQKISAGTQSPHEVNFRIQVRAVNELLDGTTCKGQQLNSNFLFPSN